MEGCSLLSLIQFRRGVLGCLILGVKLIHGTVFPYSSSEQEVLEFEWDELSRPL